MPLAIDLLGRKREIRIVQKLIYDALKVTFLVTRRTYWPHYPG